MERHFRRQSMALMSRRSGGPENTLVTIFTLINSALRWCISTRPGIDLFHFNEESVARFVTDDYPLYTYYNHFANIFPVYLGVNYNYH